MDVPVTALRAELSRWIERVRTGEEVVVTERGTPVAPLVAVDATPLLDDLAARGVIAAPPREQRPPARGATRVRASGAVADPVGDQRR